MKFVWSSLLVTALAANAEGNDNFAHKMKRGMMMGEMSMNMAKKSFKKQGSGLRASRKNPIPDFMKKEKGPAQTFVQEQDVIDGTYLLYSLEVDPDIYNVEGSDYKGYVNGRFCKIDLSSQKEDPSKGVYALLSLLYLIGFKQYLMLTTHVSLSGSRQFRFSRTLSGLQNAARKGIRSFSTCTTLFKRQEPMIGNTLMIPPHQSRFHPRGSCTTKDVVEVPLFRTVLPPSSRQKLEPTVNPFLYYRLS